MKTFEIQTFSQEKTLELASSLGELLKPGDVIALIGPLGGGKTLFTKGLLTGLGITNDVFVTSPSFTLLNEYQGRFRAHHMDIYRLESKKEFLATGFIDLLYSDDIAIIEWADKFPELLPEWTLKVEMEIISEFSRKIWFSGFHLRSIELVEKLSDQNI